jgi:large subunit ribosomal protein L4
MKINTYTKTGNKSEKKVDLIDSIWAVPMNQDLVAQVIYVYRNNQRKFSATVKTRGDVRGGGKKPWKQKGTGRARHGSIRSPLWVGGGVAFGPTGYKKTLKVPKKMKNLSLKCLLSDKSVGGDILVMNELSVEKGIKTKDMVALLKKLKVSNTKVLIIHESDLKSSENMRKGFRNIEKVKFVSAKDICSYDVIDSEKLLISEKAIKEFEERFK